MPCSVASQPCEPSSHAVRVGCAVGAPDGAEVAGEVDGAGVGIELTGEPVGAAVGIEVAGDADGAGVGIDVPGEPVGVGVGIEVAGEAVGLTVFRTHVCPEELQSPSEQWWVFTQPH